jgi:hypothetical protein
MKKSEKWQGVVVHTCNLSYSGGKGRRMVSLRPAWAMLVRPYLKNKIQKKI